MPRYRARYFFDWGSGVCLWSDNDTTRAKFGYPIESSALDVSDELRAKLDAVIALQLGQLDEADPGGPSPWSDSELRSFRRESRELLDQLRRELGDEWIIIDESNR